MAFLKRRGYKFNVDLQLLHLSDVPLVNGVLFAKVRLLNGGDYEGVTERVVVHNHSANWNRRFNFSCRILPDSCTGVLEKCACRVSLRKEQKGGKTCQKLGFVDINLSEYAASGIEGITRSYLLDGYSSYQRQDNSRLLIKVIMSHQSADPIFKVPRLESSIEEQSLNPLDRKAPASDDAFSQKNFADIDSPISSSLEDIPHHHDEIVPSVVCLVPGTSALDSFGKEVVESSKKNNAAFIKLSHVHNSNSVKKLDVSRRPAESALAQTSRMGQDRSHACKTGDCVTGVATRVRETRVNAEDLIDKMLAETGIADMDNSKDVSGDRGLTLFVSKDGEAVVGANSLQATDSFEQVHISDASSPLSTG